ncbi:MAG: DUF1844 domain-containing protein [Verrucomicrobia bacterium]|nr:DUF1844 domain-containing protein [Verrucomicrobiota bacterium]
MAEYQHTVTSAGEMTQRFIEFVLMHAQNAAFMLGQIPHPQTGKPEVNLDMAQLLIDQLVMLQDKTSGNLNSDEARILNGTIANLQIAFVEAVRKREGRGEPPAATSSAPEAAAGPGQVSRPEAIAEQQPPPDADPGKVEPAPATESRKKFVKSYGS